MTRIEIAPGSAIAGAGHRMMMVWALRELAGRPDRPTRALAKALRGTALGRLPVEERAWVEKIAEHQARLPWSEEAERAVRWMSLPPSWGRLLLRLVRELDPRSCLELGSGFGISTAYQAAALELNRAGRMISLDVAEMCANAESGLSGLGLSERVELVPGLIEETLAGAIERAAPIDYAFIDHDHTAAGTVGAFDRVLPALADGAVVVIDDINWTGEMRSAWETLRDRPRVGASVGLRRIGIVIVSGERK